MKWIKKSLRHWLLSEEVGPLPPVRAVETANMHPCTRVYRLQNGFLVEFINMADYPTSAGDNLQFFKTPKEVADALIVHYTTRAMGIASARGINAGV